MATIGGLLDLVGLFLGWIALRGSYRVGNDPGGTARAQDWALTHSVDFDSDD